MSKLRRLLSVRNFRAGRQAKIRLGCALVVALILLGCGVEAPHGADGAQLEWVVDRLEVEDLMHRYVYAVDALDREALAKIFTPDAVLEVTYADPGTETTRQHGFDAIFEAMSAQLSSRKEYGIPWHFVTSPRVEIDADRAKLTAYMHNRKTNAGGTYNLEAIRSTDGWRVTKLHVDMVY